jgi:hypothetical protein
LRFISRLTVEGERPSNPAIDLADRCTAMPLDISSRSESVSANRERRAEGRSPYLLIDATLEECLQEFMAKPLARLRD